MATLTLASIGRAALDLLYPPRCAICGHGGVFLCDECLGRLPRADGDRCPRCWLPLRSSICFACREHRPAFSALRSAFRYDGDVRGLVRAFKYGGQSSLSPALGREMLESYEAARLEAEVIVPVAMSGLRRRRRGYNQALLLAREVGRALELPVVEALSRRHFSGAQARSATAFERRRNVEGAFKVTMPQAVQGRSVLLIDDIATTGATLDACARALRQVAAHEVIALTLARED